MECRRDNKMKYKETVVFATSPTKTLQWSTTAGGAQPGDNKHHLLFGYLRQGGNSNVINTLNAELNTICYLLALLGAHHFFHVSRIRVKSLTLRLLMSYIYGAHILDVSRSHTTTHHSR